MTDAQPSASSSITLQASHSWTQVFLMAVTPRLVVDGVEMAAAWGERTFPVPPGEHRVQVYFPYLGGRAGKAECGVTLRPGDGVRLSYRAPIVVTSAGQLTLAGWAPAAVLAAPSGPPPATASSGTPSQPAPWAGAAPSAPWVPHGSGTGTAARPEMSPLARGLGILVVLAALIGIGVFAAQVLLPDEQGEQGGPVGWADAPEVGDCYTEGDADGWSSFELNAGALKPGDCSDADSRYTVVDRVDGVSRSEGFTADCSPESHVRLWYDEDGAQAPEYGEYLVERISSAEPDELGTLVCLTLR